MGGVISKVTDAVGLTDSKAGDRAADDSKKAAEIAAQGQRESLDYMKEVEKLPLEIRDKFLPQLADIYSGGQGQQNLIDSAMNSPLYKQMIGNQSLGEEAILKNASATGGLRSGDTSRALSEYTTRLNNEALNTSYGQQLSGIQGLAGIGLNTNEIAQGIAAPSNTTAQGIMAGAQARQQQTQANMNSLSGMVGTGIGAMAAFSDIRAKKDIEYIGEENGHSIFKWTWNELGEKLGLSGEGVGVMAHLIYDYMPDAIDTSEGLLMVDYEKLGLVGAH